MPDRAAGSDRVPGESTWKIGEAAGALAAFCVQNEVGASAVTTTPALLSAYQHALLAAGVPLFWWTDATSDDPLFPALNLLRVNGIVSGYHDMSFRPNNPLTLQDQQDIAGAVGQTINWHADPMTRGQAVQWLVQQLNL